MRARLMRELMAEVGVRIDIATTHPSGQRFLREADIEADVLPGGFALTYDHRQNLDREATQRALQRYLVRGLHQDMRALRAAAPRYALLVNDSFHPALLATALVSRLRHRIVNVHGENLLDAVFDELEQRGISYPLRRALSRSSDNIVHTLRNDPGPRQLWPLIDAPPDGPRAIDRAVVYLNPRFRDERLAAMIEGALRRAGYAMHAVGEGMAARPGWRGTDPSLARKIAGASILVAAPGMATLTQARAYGTPLVALVTDQPEQQKNLRFLPAWGRAVHVGRPHTARDLERAIATLPPPRVASSVHHTRQRWRQIFVDLLSNPSIPVRRHAA